MGKLKSILVFGSMISLVSVAGAETITKPHDFTSGTIIKSSQVNENFDALYDKMNEILQRLGALENPSASLTDGLIVYYPFNENANDESGNGNDGTVYGATLVTDRNGIVDSAYNFDGVDDYILIEHNAPLSLQGMFTISFWIYSDTSEGVQNVITKGRDCEDSYYFRAAGAQFSLGNGPIGAFGASCTSAGGISYSSFEQNVWNFVTGVVNDAGEMIYYYNGVNVADTNIVEYHGASNVYPLIIGRHFRYSNGSGGYEYPFSGKIDDIRIYSRALSESEIQELYNADRP